MRGLAQRAAEVGDAVAFLQAFQHGSGFAEHQVDDGDGAGLFISIGNGQGNALAFVSNPEDDETARLRRFGDMRGMYDQAAGLAGDKGFFFKDG